MAFSGTFSGSLVRIPNVVNIAPGSSFSSTAWKVIKPVNIINSTYDTYKRWILYKNPLILRGNQIYTPSKGYTINGQLVADKPSGYRYKYFFYMSITSENLLYTGWTTTQIANLFGKSGSLYAQTINYTEQIYLPSGGNIYWRGSNTTSSRLLYAGVDVTNKELLDLVGDILPSEADLGMNEETVNAFSGYSFLQPNQDTSLTYDKSPFAGVIYSTGTSSVTWYGRRRPVPHFYATNEEDMNFGIALQSDALPFKQTSKEFMRCGRPFTAYLIPSSREYLENGSLLGWSDPTGANQELTLCVVGVERI